MIYAAEGLIVKRLQFVPDSLEGIIIEYQIENTLAEEQNLKFNFTTGVDLTPVWLAERQGITDSTDLPLWNRDYEAIVVQDQGNPWTVAIGSDKIPDETYFNRPYCDFEHKGKGVDVSMAHNLKIAAGDKQILQYYISGSYKKSEDALNTNSYLKENHAALFEKKQARYREIDQYTSLNIEDKDLQKVFDWSKYNTDWLVRDVPEVGRGVSAGIPDYPWWFGADNGYTLQGVLATGRHNLAKQTIELLYDLSIKTNDNGRIIHEASTNGVVFNPGNLNETPHFAFLVWKYYTWTGDKELLNKVYPWIQKGLEWMSVEMDEDANGYPDGTGMMEIPGSGNRDD